MSRFLADTNCLVALLVPWHEHHERILHEMERRLDAGDTLVIAAPTLIETYAVLTRLPAPHRLAPADCWSLIEANFISEAVALVALSPDDYRRLLHDAPEQDISGGHIYDAVIAACARVGQVDTLLTFNKRHFLSFGGSDLTIAIPE